MWLDVSFLWCLSIEISIYAAYVGLATVAGFIWWFIYYDNGPKLPYSELVSFTAVKMVKGVCS